jgi:UDP-glucose 4-epimerase
MYLVTGCAGLLGAAFVEYLFEKGATEVVGIDNLEGGYKEHIHPSLHFYEFDLTDQAALKAVFEKHRIEYIYHFAAYAAEGLSPFIRKFNYENNLIATTNLINMAIAHSVRRFIFTSSMAVYGAQTPPFDETMRPEPIDPYGIAKYAAEMDIQVAGSHHGLEWCIIRPHNVYGRFQNIWDRYRNVLGIWTYQAINGEPLTIYGDGAQTRAFTYIDDILEPLYKSSTDPRAKNQIINLGGIHEVSVADACKIFCDITGYTNVVHMEPRYEAKHSYCTYQKSVDLLDFEHKTDLREGLTKMYEWAVTQPNRPRKKWEHYELDKGLYSYWR